MKSGALAALRFYKRNVSPALPAGCRYQPTCSEYTYEAIERHGVVKGIALGSWRLLRCNPFSKGGIDPVPGSSESIDRRRVEN
jgi:putative membrane protein insertion efficiency factor